MDTDEDVYHAAPQTQGKAAHESIDRKTYSNRKNDILSMPVFCDELGIMGKIDLLKVNEQQLIERKYQLRQLKDKDRELLFQEIRWRRQRFYFRDGREESHKIWQRHPQRPRHCLLLMQTLVLTKRQTFK